jgi:sugar/nucleoside kinase (ribokinase family)
LNVFEQFKPVLTPEAAGAPYLFLGNIDPDLQLNVCAQAKNPQFVAADTIECYLENKPERFREVLKRINLLFINDSEALLFTGCRNTVAAAKSLLAMGPDYVIIKKGEHGSILVSRDMFFAVPAFAVENVLDPTGAGDSYAGGVMGYIARAGKHDHATLRRAVVYGGLVASFAVEGFSIDALRSLTVEMLEERMKIFRDMTAF